MYFSGLFYIDKQMQDDHLEPTYNTSVPIQDEALQTYRTQWMIEKGGKRGSEISMLIARPDDDDDINHFSLE